MTMLYLKLSPKCQEYTMSICRADLLSALPLPKIKKCLHISKNYDIIKTVKRKGVKKSRCEILRVNNHVLLVVKTLRWWFDSTLGEGYPA